MGAQVAVARAELVATARAVLQPLCMRRVQYAECITALVGQADGGGLCPWLQSVPPVVVQKPLCIAVLS